MLGPQAPISEAMGIERSGWALPLYKFQTHLSILTPSSMAHKFNGGVRFLYMGRPQTRSFNLPSPNPMWVPLLYTLRTLDNHYINITGQSIQWSSQFRLVKELGFTRRCVVCTKRPQGKGMHWIISMRCVCVYPQHSGGREIIENNKHITFCPTIIPFILENMHPSTTAGRLQHFLF